MDECETCAVMYLAEFSEKHGLPWEIGKNGWLYHTNKKLTAGYQNYEYHDLLHLVEAKIGEKKYGEIALNERLPLGGAVPEVRRLWKKMQKFAEESRAIKEREKYRNSRYSGRVHRGSAMP